MSTSAPKRHRIGFALSPKKIQSFIQSSLLSHAASHCIDLIAIDPSAPLNLQGPFDCLIHKIHGDDWKAQLHEFASLNPNVPVVDPPECIERLHNRISMIEVAQRLNLSETLPQKLEVPEQVVLNAEGSPKLALNSAKFGFPLLAKPLVADGSANSHQMYLIFDPNGLEKARDAAPVILQEFVNHGGVIFKVYVAGRHVRCVKRKSLRDITEEDMVNLRGASPFAQISNLTAHKKVEDGEERTVDIDDTEMPPVCFIEEVAEAMRKELGLHLFNFDLIRDVKNTNRYLVIDINYFPGFAKLPNYEAVLTEFFEDVLMMKNVDPKNEQVRALGHT